jgi:hypothetical protein
MKNILLYKNDFNIKNSIAVDLFAMTKTLMTQDYGKVCICSDTIRQYSFKFTDLGVPVK